MSDTVKVILDTDIGSDIDDALALAYLLCQPRCELMGVTTVSGQADLRAEMVSALCRQVGRDEVPIHIGADRPWLIESRQPKAPQAAALGDWPRNKKYAPATAIEFLRQTIRANPGEITLLAIGPLTNVALLFSADPEIPALLKDLVLMGGVFFDRNYPEWNILNDPHAAAVVYGEGTQARPARHVSYGLDVTTQCTMVPEQCRKKFTAKSLQPVRDFAEVWFAGGAGRVTFHDPLAAACIFQPELCTYRQGRVRVSMQPPTSGYTVFAKEEQGPHTVAENVNAEAFFQHYFDILK
jgi:purine nucleosidase